MQVSNPGTESLMGGGAGNKTTCEGREEDPMVEAENGKHGRGGKGGRKRRRTGTTADVKTSARDVKNSQRR